MFSKAYRINVANTGTEKEFIMKLINTITGLSNRITCSGSVTQYDSSDTSIQPTFILKVDNKPIIQLKRSTAIANNNQNFLITLYAGDRVLCSDQECYCSPSSWNKNAVTTRNYYLSWIVSNELIFLSICATCEHYGWKQYITVSLKGKDSLYCSGYSQGGSVIGESQLLNIDTNPSNQSFYYYDANSVLGGSFKSSFQHKAAPGYVDYIRNSIYIDASTEIFNIPGIYDCTTVTLGDTVSLNDGVYYAVGPHQLVKVS